MVTLRPAIARGARTPQTIAALRDAREAWKLKDATDYLARIFGDDA